MVITIPGKPVGKARPRFRRAGFKVITYTPPENKKVRKGSCKDLQAEYRRALHGHPSESPNFSEISDSRELVKNKEKALKGEIMPNKKPDLDNIAKIILDGLNGVAYTDDKQVTSMEIEKVYSDEPCVVVYIAEDE